VLERPWSRTFEGPKSPLGFLRTHDAFPEDKDSSDEMVFGDDDNLEDYE
jgi:hypothetical protein